MPLSPWLCAPSTVRTCVRPVPLPRCAGEERSGATASSSTAKRGRWQTAKRAVGGGARPQRETSPRFAERRTAYAAQAAANFLSWARAGLSGAPVSGVKRMKRLPWG